MTPAQPRVAVMRRDRGDRHPTSVMAAPDAPHSLLGVLRAVVDAEETGAVEVYVVSGSRTLTPAAYALQVLEHQRQAGLLDEGTGS